MFDFFLTIVLIYLAYRGYNWYTQLQARVAGGRGPSTELEDEDIVVNPKPAPGREDDYIDYEEVP